MFLGIRGEYLWLKNWKFIRACECVKEVDDARDRSEAMRVLGDRTGSMQVLCGGANEMQC